MSYKYRNNSYPKLGMIMMIFNTSKINVILFTKKIAFILKELCNEKTNPKLGMDMNIENEAIYGFGVSPNFSCGRKHCVCEFDLDKWRDFV